MDTVQFLHTADLHLDEPVKGWKGSKEDLWRRHEEYRNTFSKIVQLCADRKIPLLLIAGDFLEHGYVTNQTVEFVLEQFAKIPHTQIFIAPGNHDPYQEGSWYKKPIWPEHVHIFSPRWEKYEFAKWNLEIYGKGFADFEERSRSLPEKSNTPFRKLLLVHGDYQKSGGKSDFFPILEKDLISYPFDYVALGHIHKACQFQLKNERNTIVRYPGTPESLSWKELGERTVTIGKLTRDGVEIEVVPVHTKQYILQEISVDNCSKREKLFDMIMEQGKHDWKNCYVTVRLVGRRVPELDIEKEKGWLINKFHEYGYHDLYLEDETIPDFDLERLKRQDRLIQRFIEKMEEKMDEERQSSKKEIIKKALYKGLEAFMIKELSKR